jgi:hypothetical protein
MATLDAVAARLGPVQALVGHSLGALAIVCVRPAGVPRWFDSVQKVVLVSMPSGAPFLTDAFLRMFSIGAATGRHLQRLFRQRFGADPAHFAPATGVIPGHVPTLVVHDRSDDVVPFSSMGSNCSTPPPSRPWASSSMRVVRNPRPQGKGRADMI